MKRTIAARLQEQREHKPNPVLYAILRLVVAIIGAPLKIKFIYKARPAEDKGPIVLVANHASRIDYVYTAPAVGSKRLNYVVGYNEFFVFPTNILLKVAQVIPKRNFTPDLHAVQSMMRIIREGGNICFMPEGMNSITGMAQPVMWGTGKLLRKLGVNVYYTKIKGGYLSNTKHCQKQRPGRTEVVVDRMFTADELKQLSDVQIEDRMNRLLAHDDYMWNAVEKIKFDAKGRPAEKLETLLYMCPKCGAMHKMVSDATTLTCTECGNKVEIDEYGAIRPAGPDSVCPPLVTDWTLLERKRAASDVREPGFSYSGHVRIGLLPDYKYLTGGKTSEICGDGTLTLSAAGLHFDGTVKGGHTSWDIPISVLPTFGMCTDISRFYTFIGGEFWEFYPDGSDALRWDHLTEEMHRFQGGKWQDTAYRHDESRNSSADGLSVSPSEAIRA